MAAHNGVGPFKGTLSVAWMEGEGCLEEARLCGACRDKICRSDFIYNEDETTKAHIQLDLDIVCISRGFVLGFEGLALGAV